MNATKPLHPTSDLTVMHVLARLLERLDHSAIPVGADQYRSVVEHLSKALNDAQPGPELGALLNSHPSMAEMYENTNYAYAGLCRSPLDAALAAERLAKEAIDRAMRDPKEDSTHGKT